MNLIDVHCHLMHEKFKDDLTEVLERAANVGVKAILCSGVNPVSNRQVLELARKHPLIKASLGIYPIDALGLSEKEYGLPRQIVPIDLEEEFAFIEKNKDEALAIGEVGMDFHWADKEATGQQQGDTFRKIIRFAIRLKKPLVIHSRKAEEECLDILEQEIKHREIPVIQHCFSGRKSLMTRAAELGHYFSIPPNILRSGNFQTLVRRVPLTQLLTETDAPYLSSLSGERNEPGKVIESVQKIAEIKGITVKEAAAQIWKNYQRIFL